MSHGARHGATGLSRDKCSGPFTLQTSARGRTWSPACRTTQPPAAGNREGGSSCSRSWRDGWGPETPGVHTLTLGVFMCIFIRDYAQSPLSRAVFSPCPARHTQPWPCTRGLCTRTVQCPHSPVDSRNRRMGTASLALQRGHTCHRRCPSGHPGLTARGSRAPLPFVPPTARHRRLPTSHQHLLSGSCPRTSVSADAPLWVCLYQVDIRPPGGEAELGCPAWRT